MATPTFGLMTRDDVAEWLGVSSRQVDRLRASNGLPTYKLSSGTVRFRLEDLETWLATKGAK